MFPKIVIAVSACSSLLAIVMFFTILFSENRALISVPVFVLLLTGPLGIKAGLWLKREQKEPVND